MWLSYASSYLSVINLSHSKREQKVKSKSLYVNRIADAFRFTRKMYDINDRRKRTALIYN